MKSNLNANSSIKLKNRNLSNVFSSNQINSKINQPTISVKSSTETKKEKKKDKKSEIIPIKTPPKIKTLGKDSYLFTLDFYDTFTKPVKNCVILFKYFFLSINIFNVLYLVTNLFQIYTSSLNPDVDFILSGITGLIILTFVFGIRIFKSLFGVYSSLCAKNRKPLYYFLIFNYITSAIYIFCCLYILFSSYLPNKFDRSMVNHLVNLEKHDEYEEPRWYWIEHTQFHGKCCGYQSFADYIAAYAIELKAKVLDAPDLYLPYTCCINNQVGKLSDIDSPCTIYNLGLNKKGCANELIKEELENIITPTACFIIMDLILVFISIYLMIKFNDHKYRIEIKEKENNFLDREEERLINELLNLKVINQKEIDLVKTKFRFIIRVEKASNRRATMEGLTIIIRKIKENLFLKIVNANLFKKIQIKDYQNILKQTESNIIDLFDEKELEQEKKIETDKEKKKEETLNKENKELEDLLQTEIKKINILKMTGGEDLTKILPATKENVPEYLKKKIKSYQAVRTRNTIFEINKRLDAFKTIKNEKEKPVFFRINSLDLRCDKNVIENEIKELKKRAETLPQTYKEAVISSGILTEGEEDKSYKIKKQRRRKGISKLLKFGKKRKPKVTSEIFDEAFSDTDSDSVWTDID